MFRPPTLLHSPAYTVPRLCSRPFSTTSPSLSTLFNLNGLAHSRESQYLSKERGIPRTEYSSNIHLIRSSEVDPFPNAPGASKHANPDLSRKLSQKQRVGRRAAIAALMDDSNEDILQYLSDSSRPAQQRKRIEEYVAQQTALKTSLRAEIVRLQEARAATQPGGSGRDNAQVHVQDLPKYLSKEEIETKAVETSAAEATETVLEKEVPQFSTVSEAEVVILNELHNPRQSQKSRSPLSRNPLSFLWAST